MKRRNSLNLTPKQRACLDKLCRDMHAHFHALRQQARLARILLPPDTMP